MTDRTHTGPYVVTHKVEAFPIHSGVRVLSRVAVETLQGARSWVYNAVSRVPHQPGESSEISDSIPADGGSVTLPDGSTISVEPVTWEGLANSVGVAYRVPASDDHGRQILKAFNESEEAKR